MPDHVGINRQQNRQHLQIGKHSDLRVTYYCRTYLTTSHVACQRRQGLRPLSLVMRLPCAEVDSHGAELRGARRLWRASVDVAAPGDLEIDEPGSDDRCVKLCLQQSAGDSTLPEIDVLFAFVRDCFLHEDVADLKATARLEHARHFLQSGKLIGKEVENAI